MNSISRSNKKRKLEDLSGSQLFPLQQSKRCYQPDRISYLEQQLQSSAVSSPRKFHQKRIRLKLRRELTIGQMAMIIYLRHHSLNSDLHTYHSFPEIQQRTGIKPGTCHAVVKRWQKNNYQINCGIQYRGRRPLYDETVERRITSIKALTEMAHMSLIERTEYISRQYNLPKLSTCWLRNVYRRQGVKYMKPQYSYSPKFDPTRQMQQEQQEFAKRLTDILRSNTHVVYVDEATFHQWQYNQRSWVKRGVHLSINQRRGKSISLIGAISSQRGLIHFAVFEGSNNQITFSAFIEAVLSKIKGKCVIVMDNLSVHKAKCVRQQFNENSQVLYTPPYSCAFNSIERMWAMIKRQWRKAFTLQMGNRVDNASAIERLKEIVIGVDNSFYQRLSKSNFKSLIHSLRGHMV